jgi:hypothetical protein
MWTDLQHNYLGMARLLSVHRLQHAGPKWDVRIACYDMNHSFSPKHPILGQAIVRKIDPIDKFVIASGNTAMT